VGRRTHVEFETLLKGFNGARSRFSASRAGSDECFQAIFEALAWVGAMRDRLREEQKPPPPALDGLYYVRNLVLHQGADVLEWFLIPPGVLGGSVLGGSVIGGGGSQAIWWPDRSEMPAPRSPAGRDEYDAHVAGNQVGDVLATVADAFA
jgi:hypothetical protein